jgi:hypothetical protein
MRSFCVERSSARSSGPRQRTTRSVGGFGGWLRWLVVHVTFLTGFKNRFAAPARWTISFVGRGRYERALTGSRVVDGDHPTDSA